MNIGLLSLGIAMVLGIVCVFCIAYDTIPHETKHDQPHKIDFTKLNPIEL